MPLYIVCCTAVLLVSQNKQSTTEQKTEHQTVKSDEKRPGQRDSGTSHGPIDILSDTGGSDVRPYAERVASVVKANWYSLIPESAQMKQGKVSIKFNILKDGVITDVVYVDRSGDATLDRASYGAITSANPLPLLPSDFNCKFLALKFTFYYNLETPPFKGQRDPLIPCVTTKIGSVQPVTITVSPVSAEVISGARQQFSLRVTGDENAEAKWTVSGPGCSESACGSISPQGLYVAPSIIPSPPKVVVTATLTTDPSQTATATVTVVKSPTSR